MSAAPSCEKLIPGQAAILALKIHTEAVWFLKPVRSVGNT